LKSKSSQTNLITGRVLSIDLLRGIVIVIMALDHVRMYFGHGTWYSSPTDLATTTPLLFFTRWVTHFCAPTFIFLAGISAFLHGMKQSDVRHTSLYLFTRGLWLVFVELIIVNFGWTFDTTYSFIILQVIWVIGVSMILLAVLVYLPTAVILAIGLGLVFGHNLLDRVTVQGSGILDTLWYILHQPHLLIQDERVISIYYSVLPWLGLMVLGYVAGGLYRRDFPASRRVAWLLAIGSVATILFLLLRWSNSYGEPTTWQTQDSSIFTGISFLNTTKYPPSLQFLLMTVGPALLFLAFSESFSISANHPFVTFGKVPFFFYILHIYLIHALALLALTFSGWDWREYILTAGAFLSRQLNSFGFGLGIVYAIWILVLVILYPLCRWYQQVKENHPAWWWLGYL
jgi:uncharacterized membrane protein